MKLSVAIMTHPARIQLAQELQLHLGMGKITGLSDKGAWYSAEKSWQAYDRDADYHMVIQDDVWCEKTFIDDVHYVLSFLPQLALVSLQDIHAKPEYRWRVAQDLNNSRCILMPTLWIDDFLQWTRDNVLEALRPDDVRITLWAHARQKLIWFPNPPLVYQRDTYSYYNDRPDKQQEYPYIGNRSVKDFNWEYGERLIKNWAPAASLLYEWALGKLIYEYPQDVHFTKDWFTSQPNCQVFTSLSVTQDELKTKDGTAITLPPFTDVVIPNTITLPAGQYRVEASMMASHLLEGNDERDFPPNFDSQIKPLTEGAGDFYIDLLHDGKVLRTLKRGLFFNSGKLRKTFYIQVNAPLQVRIRNQVWGNVATQFCFKFFDPVQNK